MLHGHFTLKAMSIWCISTAAITSSVVGQQSSGQGNVLDSPLDQQNANSFRPGTRNTAPSGSGSVLDANLAIGADGSRNVRNYQGYRQDFQVGNLLVTGSVAGGKNFRGQVGYTAPSDFRGVVGADSIYPALRGSGLSQIQYVNSAMSNDRYANALGMGLYEYRRDYTPAPQIYRTSQVAEINQDRIRLDRTNAYTASRDLYETAVNSASLRLVEEEREDRDTPVLLSVETTPFQGLYLREIEPTAFSLTELDMYGRAALLSDARARGLDRRELGLVYETPTADVPPEQMLNNLLESAPAVGDQLDTRIQGNLLQQDEDQFDAYERVVRELVQRYGSDDSVKLDVNPDVLARVRAELDEIRALTMGYELAPSIDFDSDQNLLDVTPAQPADATTRPEEEPSDSSTPPDDETEEEMRARLKAERIKKLEQAAALIRNGGRVNSFSEGQIGRIEQLMQAGENFLRTGSFFNAESRFDQVLRINPGNPLALFGRANAQLGAGLYLSSALSLRKLFMGYPELIGTSIAPEFLPSETRLRLSRLKLLERIERGKDLPSYGLCLAYVGRLLNEPTTVSEGLSYLADDSASAALADLLRRVWLEGEQPTPTKE